MNIKEDKNCNLSLIVNILNSPILSLIKNALQPSVGKF